MQALAEIKSNLSIFANEQQLLSWHFCAGAASFGALSRI